jgi:type II secretory pathway pseudopilin PulG
MKLRKGNQRSRAMTLVEVFMVVACAVVLAYIILPWFARAKIGGRPNCATNLKQINLAFFIWGEDNNNKYPTAISVTDGGAMELIKAGNVAGLFQVMSNELSTPRVLVCPADTERTFVTNWNELNEAHISYFISADVSNKTNRNLVLDGDDNLIIGGAPVKSGLLEFSSNSPIAWSDKRHKYVGILGFADGSVREESQSSMQQAFQGTGLATNRIAIP